jgi:hypothetical protein
MNNFAAGFGDYLVPVLVVIWVIFSLMKKFRGVRTTPNAENDQEEVQDNTGSIKTLLEQMLLGEEFTAKQPTRNAAQTTTHDEKEVTPVAFRSSSEPAPFLTYENSLYKGGEMTEGPGFSKMEATILPSREEITPVFTWESQDMKRAIILSEILKRPYL